MLGNARCKHDTRNIIPMCNQDTRNILPLGKDVTRPGGRVTAFPFWEGCHPCDAALTPKGQEREQHHKGRALGGKGAMTLTSLCRKGTGARSNRQFKLTLCQLRLPGLRAWGSLPGRTPLFDTVFARGPSTETSTSGSTTTPIARVAPLPAGVPEGSQPPARGFLGSGRGPSEGSQLTLPQGR